MIYKKLLRKIIAKSDNWNDFSKALSDYADKSKKSKEGFVDLNNLFTTFAKYYFLADPVTKSLYKNVWLFEEIPKDLKNKLKL